MALTRITSDGITDGTITGTDLATNIDLVDNQKLRLGTGNDLQIYHDGTNTYLDNNTGQFNIDGASGNAIRFLNNGTYQCQIGSAGLDLPDTKKIRIGDSEDLEIQHDGTNNLFKSTTASEIQFLYGSQYMLRCIPSGAVRIYHANSTKAQTTSTGFMVNGNLELVDNNKLYLGASGDLQIYHDGSDSLIKDAGTGLLGILTNGFRVNNAANNESMIKADENGAVELYYNGSKKFETYNGGCQMGGDLSFSDSQVANFGTGSDLQIYHDGSNSRIVSLTGELQNFTHNFRVLNDAGNEIILQGAANGAVELYYNNYKAYVTNGGGGPSNGMLSADSVLNLNTSQDGSGSDYFVRGSKNSTVVGGGNDVFWIYEDGDMYNVNGTFSQSSDIKLKENIVDASSQWSDIKALKVRKFNFKASTGYGTHTQIGMVAQEVETTCPGLITERVDLQKTENSDKTWTETDTGEKTKSIKLTVLYMKAVKALQEAMTRIETLETEVAALKAG